MSQRYRVIFNRHVTQTAQLVVIADTPNEAINRAHEYVRNGGVAWTDAFVMEPVPVFCVPEKVE